ncbi:MAG: hypothetical protein ABI925_07505 [Verrucomicrobiota bacterium]
MSRKSIPHHDSKPGDGFALIITLIMVVLAAVVAVAFITNASLDRLTANSFSKRARAEMAAQSGLAAALNQLANPNDFRFITAVGDDGDPAHSKPVLIPLTSDPATGVVSLDTASKRDLYSTGSGAAITLSATASPKATRAIGYVPINTNTNGVNQETERYAFYVDEGGSRQNLAIQGGSDRIYARDPNELPIVSTTPAPPSPPVTLSSTQVNAIKDKRPLLFTPMTTNPVLSDAGVPTTPPVDDYSFATASAIANLNPEGKPRVTLMNPPDQTDKKCLKKYVDSLPFDQTPNNLRSHLVNRLLGLENPQNSSDWGGGDLSILLKLSHYTPTQAKQIVASLLDYLDEDLIPTTDDMDNPTYFGVEGKDLGDGTWVGHPYINFVGTGLIFNRSGQSGNVGGLNSTRIVLVLGLVNPWRAPTKDWDFFYVEPEVEIHITGTASGGTLGSNASSYFQEIFSSTLPDPSGNPEKLYPVKNIPPRTGYCFPIKMSGTTNYATYKELKGTRPNGLGQPPGMVFTNLGFQIKKLRLKYKISTNSTYVVQVLDNLKNMTQDASPTTVDCDHSNNPSALVYKFTGSAPGYENKKDFHLNTDPRLNFLVSDPQNAAAKWWILSKSTEAALAPPTPQTAVNAFTSHDPNNWDFTTPPTMTNHLWYTTADVTANFYVKSPQQDGSNPKLNSAGELGYLHTGIPWETLRFYVTGGEAAGKERDKELLAYVHSGTFQRSDYTTPSSTPIELISGPLNVNSNKRPTLQSLFLGASEKSDNDATNKAKNGGDANAVTIADALAANAAVAPLGLPGDFLSLPSVKTITNAQTTDFDREVLTRRAANVLGTQSTRFTVYSLGEARDKVGISTVTTSSVSLRAEVELQPNSSGKPVPKVLSTAYYLNN